MGRGTVADGGGAPAGCRNLAVMRGPNPAPILSHAEAQRRRGAKGVLARPFIMQRYFGDDAPVTGITNTYFEPTGTITASEKIESSPCTLIATISDFFIARYGPQRQSTTTSFRRETRDIEFTAHEDRLST